MEAAEEHVYSAWQETKSTGGEDERKAFDRDRSAPEEIYLLREIGERTELPE
jgi:hypothetical protein